MKRSKLSAELAFFPLWLLAGAFELPTMAAMFGVLPDVPGWLVASAHAAAAAIVFVAPPRGKGLLSPTRHWAQPLALLTLLVPGVGWVLSGWLVLRHSGAPHDKEAYRFDGPDEKNNPLAGFGTPEAIHRELTEALEVIPAVDALMGRAPELKRGAIETLARIRTPQAIDWIFQARVDGDPEARFYATTALTRLKRDFELAVQAAERECYRHPGEAGTQLALQRIRYEHAVSGLLEPGARAAVLEDCRARLLGPAERSQEALRLLYFVERELAPERALPLLERLQSGDPQGGRRWARERVELLFSLGRFREVAELLRRHGAGLAGEEDASLESGEWRSAVLWWSA